MSAQTRLTGQVATGRPDTTRAPAARRTGSWFASPPPSVAVEIGAGRVTAVVLGDGGWRADGDRAGDGASARRPGRAVAHDAQPHRQDRRRRGGAARAAGRRREPRPGGGGDPRRGRQGLGGPLREGAGEGRGSRPAGALAGAQVGAVPDRAVAGVVDAGRHRRQRDRLRRDRRAAGHRPGLRTGGRRGRCPGRPRRPRDLQPGEPPPGRRCRRHGDGRLAARPRHARRQHDGDRPRRRAAAVPAPAGRRRGQPVRSRPPDRDVLRRSPRRPRPVARRDRGRATSGRASAATCRPSAAPSSSGSARPSRRSIRGRWCGSRPRAASPASAPPSPRRSACCCGSGCDDDAADQPRHPAVLQRAPRSLADWRRRGPRGRVHRLQRQRIPAPLRPAGRPGRRRRARRGDGAHPDGTRRRGAPAHRREEPRAHQRPGGRGQRHHRRADVLVDGVVRRHRGDAAADGDADRDHAEHRSRRRHACGSP